MNSKQLVFLPLLALGLTSCRFDTTPKPLSYNAAISYIEKNSKGKATPKSGVVTYSCKDVPSGTIPDILKYFGVTDTTKKQGSNEIDSTKIENDYIKITDTNPSSKDRVDLPLMYLTKTNFASFVKDQHGFSYSLTYIKEFVMYHIPNDDLYYTRYYDTSLRLYKFEIHSAKSGEEYDVTQVYSY